MDDAFTAALDDDVIFAKAKSAIPLAIDTMFRPVVDDEPIPCEKLIQALKLLGKGTPEETIFFS